MRPRVLKPARITEIDFLRGFLILFMVVDHFFYDFTSWGGIFTSFFNFPIDAPICQFADWYWEWPVRIYGRFIVLSLFFLISGISSYFSRNNLKRGLLIFGVGILVDIGFLIFSKITGENMYVFFGAISCFGLSILLYWLLRFIFTKLQPKRLGDFKWIILGLGLMIIPIGVMFGVWTLRGPNYAYDLKNGNWFFVIIGAKQDVNAADWLPLFPYLGLMFIGAFLGEIIYHDRVSLFTSHTFSQFHYKQNNNQVDCTYTYRQHQIKYLIEVPPKEKAKIDFAKKEINQLVTTHRLEKYSNRYIRQHYRPKALNYGLISPLLGLREGISFLGHYSIFVYLLHQIALILIIGIILLGLGFKLNLPL
ncbi:MAG: DUF1624 domain-containing protein [Bacilli bacterium]|nr:DUF1624 domain-containing protein [Bacilli bacterium]